MDAVGYKITKEMKLALWSTSIINLSQKLKLVVHVKLVAIYQTRNKFTQNCRFPYGKPMQVSYKAVSIRKEHDLYSS